MASFEEAPSIVPEPNKELEERHYSINYGDTGHTYDSDVRPLSPGREEKSWSKTPMYEPQHQIANFVRFCETVVKCPTVRKIRLVTGYDDKTDLALLMRKSKS